MSSEVIVEAIDRLDPMIDMINAISSALQWNSFDEVSLRLGLCVALDMSAQEIEKIRKSLHKELYKGV